MHYETEPLKGKNTNYSNPCEEDEIDLYEIWLILKKRKKIIGFFTFLFTIIGLTYALLATPIYKTETSIYPLVGNDNKKGISGLAGSLIGLPLNQSSLTVEAILKSKTLKARIIKELNLMPLLFESDWNKKTQSWKTENPPSILDGIEELDKLMSVSTDKKTGVITLAVEFPKYPEVAFKIAETALKEVQKILDEKTWTLAKKKRVFLERQIKKVLEKVKVLENIYKQFMEGKIKEVPFVIDSTFLQEIPSLDFKEFNSKNNIDKDSLNKKFKNLKNFPKINYQKIRNISDFELNYQKLQWQLDILKNLLENLFKQYEMAKTEEIKEQVAFQIVDPPYVPQKPYKPKKVLIIAVAFISGLFIGIFFVFFKEWLDNVKEGRKKGGSIDEKK